MENEQPEHTGQTLRQYIESGFSFDAYFKSKVPLNSRGQEFYRLMGRPSSITDELLSLFPASDAIGKDEQEKSIQVTLGHHLDDLVVGVRKQDSNKLAG